jgi:hypothetical protein
MNKIFKLLSILTLAILFVNCEKDDDPSVAVRDFQTQYNSDIADIEKFLKTHTYSVVDNPGSANDQDVTFTEVPLGTPNVIWDSPLLDFRPVTKNGVDYKVYFLKLREGGGAEPTDLDYPTNVDAVLVSYVGNYLFHKMVTIGEGASATTIDSLKMREFESNSFPQSFFSLQSVIQGWGEVLPQFMAGDFEDVSGAPTVYTGFGAGVMFIPSGLAYYGAPPVAIPAYSPLIFNFKLLEINRLDHDGDGIPSYLEDITPDRYMRLMDVGVDNPDDSDGDDVPDFMDLDDDNDGQITKFELRREFADVVDPISYYSFNGAAEDDSSTPNIDETQGVPSCGTTPDYFSPGRLRRYLDPTCRYVDVDAQ